MNNKEELSNLFGNILGVKVNLIGEDTSFDEQTFITAITNWEQAWKVQNQLLLNCGILLEGYDGLLYTALDNLAQLTFGKEKADIIGWYIYQSKRDDGSTYKIIDPRDKKEYILATPKDLYDFLKTVTTYEFDIEDDGTIGDFPSEDEDDQDL